MAARSAVPKSALPRRQPTRYQRRSAAERSFALNAVPEPPEEPPLQTLPRDLLRAHVFEAVNLWDLGRLGCAATWLAETVFDDQKAWERRNGGASSSGSSSACGSGVQPVRFKDGDVVRIFGLESTRLSHLNG